MDKRELEIAIVSAKNLSVQTVASSNAKVYGIISLVNGSEFSQWKTSEAEDVKNPRWDEVIKMVLDEDAIQHDSAHLLISICVKKENAMQDEEVGYLSLPLRSFLSHVGTLVVRDYPLQPIQGPLTLELVVKLSDKFIPDVSMAATQPAVMSMPANYAVTLPGPLMSPYYFHSPRPTNSGVTPPAPANFVVTPPAPLMSPNHFHSPRPANPVVTSPAPANSVVTPPGPLMSPYYFHSPRPANSVVTPPGPLMSPYYCHSLLPANPVVTSPAPANSEVTPPAPLMSPYYLYSPPPVNSVVTPPAPLMSPYYFHPRPPSSPIYPPHPYPPRPSFYQGLSSLQLLLEGAATFNAFQNFVMSTFGDGGNWGDWGAGSM